MSLFQAFCVFVPALLVLAVTAVAAWRRETAGPAWRDGGIAFAALLLSVVLAWTLSGEPFLRAARVLLFSAAFASCFIGLFIALVACRVRPAAAQAAAGVAVALAMGAIFLAGDAVEAAPIAAKAGRAELFVQFSPYCLIAGDIFEIDVLHTPALYAMHLADYLRGIPSSGRAVLAYAAAGLFLAGGGLGIRKAAERFS